MVGIRVSALPPKASELRGVGELLRVRSPPNLASRETVAVQAMEVSKRSRGHRENLLRAQATHMGLGVAARTHDRKNYYKILLTFMDDCMLPDSSPR